MLHIHIKFNCIYFNQCAFVEQILEHIHKLLLKDKNINHTAGLDFANIGGQGLLNDTHMLLTSFELMNILEVYARH